MTKASTLHRLVWWSLAAVAALVVAVGAGGAQVAGGVLDPSFGNGGKVVTATRSYDGANAVAIQLDGKIVVAGSSETGSFSGGWRSDHFAVVRYTPSGRLDASFGRDGRAVANFGTKYGAEAVAIEKSGNIVSAGGSNGDFVLVRYTPSGRLDASFGRDGRVRTDLGGYGDDADAVVVQKNGKIVAAGISNARDSDDFALVRYTPSGNLDRRFGRAGRVLTSIGDDDGALAMAVQEDGEIVLAGYGERAGSGRYDFALARYTVDGKLDASFGTSGKVLTDLGGGDEQASAVVVEEDGKIVAAGYSDNDFAVVRYTPSGKLDASFGRGGKVVTDFGGNDQASAAAIQLDGKIVVAGSGDAGRSEDLDFALARYTTDGKPDPSFSSSGKMLTDLLAKSDDSAAGIAIQRDGKFIVAGTTRDDGSAPNVAVVRYTK